MKIILSPSASEHLKFWKRTNPDMVKRIKRLLEDIKEHPFEGIGKPEPLKYGLSGKWSRRINAEHRLIYSISEEVIEVYVLSMRHHYNK